MRSEIKKYKRLEDEEWRKVPKSNGRYWISSYGRVKSFVLDKKNGRLLKPAIIKKFRYVILRYNNTQNRFFIHKLVASLWLPKPKKNQTFVTHLDRNIKNNHYSNLKWISLEESNAINAEYFRKKYTGIKHPGERHHTKLKEKDIIQLKKMLLRGIPQVKIAKLFCISEMQVTRIKRGENWGDVKIPDTKKSR